VRTSTSSEIFAASISFLSHGTDTPSLTNISTSKFSCSPRKSMPRLFAKRSTANGCILRREAATSTGRRGRKEHTSRSRGVPMIFSSRVRPHHVPSHSPSPPRGLGRVGRLLSVCATITPGEYGDGKPVFTAIATSLGQLGRMQEWLAGAGGFEPRNDKFEIGCCCLCERSCRTPLHYNS
jgi:hypothetical protein